RGNHSLEIASLPVEPHEPMVVVARHIQIAVSSESQAHRTIQCPSSGRNERIHILAGVPVKPEHRIRLATADVKVSIRADRETGWGHKIFAHGDEYPSEI